MRFFPFRLWNCQGERIRFFFSDVLSSRWGAIGCFFFAMLFAIVLAFDCKMSQKLVAGVSLLNRLLLLSPGISFHPSLSLIYLFPLWIIWMSSKEEQWAMVPRRVNKYQNKEEKKEWPRSSKRRSAVALHLPHFCVMLLGALAYARGCDHAPIRARFKEKLHKSKMRSQDTR